MTLYMVDRASAPSNSEVDALIQQGVSEIAGYVGGRNSGGSGWTKEVINYIDSKGLKFVPIYVGENVCDGCAEIDWSRAENDGRSMAQRLHDLNIVSGPAVLDIEYGMYEQYPSQTVDYAHRYSSILYNNGYLPVAYGTLGLAHALNPVVPTGFWLADWINVVPNLFSIPNAENYHGLGWQYTGSGGFDWNVVDGKWWEGDTTMPILNVTYPGELKTAPDGSQYRYFKETGHNLSHGFRAFWESFGALEVFGFPISEEFERLMEDGTKVNCQYFERARFEYRPGSNPNHYDVQLGLIGTAIGNIDKIKYSTAFEPQ